jgi:hypothetical protein
MSSMPPVLNRSIAGRRSISAAPAPSAAPAASNYVHGTILPVDSGWLGR